MKKTPDLKTNPAAGALQDALEHERVSAAQAARAMRIPRSRLCDIFADRKGVSADTALRFERYLGIPAALILQLQSDYDLSKAVREKGKVVEREVEPLKAAS